MTLALASVVALVLVFSLVPGWALALALAEAQKNEGYE